MVCVCNDGTIDVKQYVKYINLNRERIHLILDSALESNQDDGESNREPAILAREPKTCAPRVVYPCKDLENSPLVIIPPKESMWYKMNVSFFILSRMLRCRKSFMFNF